VAISLALGILLGGVAPLQPQFLLIAAGGLALVGLVLLLFRAPPKWCFTLTLAVIAVTGAADAMLRSSQFTGSRLSAVLSDEPRLLRLRGLVENMPEERILPGRRRGEEDCLLSNFTLRVTHVLHQGRCWIPLTGRLRVMGEGSARHLTHGDALELTLSAQRVTPPKNPGEFDYAEYLARNGIAGQARVGDMAAIRPAGTGKRISGKRWVFALKRRIVEALEQRVEPAAASILKCLILGERHALTPAQERAFRETGTVHFLAISGLHVGLLALFCWWALLVLRVRHPVAAVVVLTVVLLYAVLAGFRPSVQRAAVMCAVICGAFIFYRKPNVATSLALALIMVLLHEPAQLYGAGLQLSFVAVLGIWLFSGPIERAIFNLPDELDRLQAPEERSWYQHAVRWVIQKTLAISFAAWLAALPLRLLHFNMMTPLAPFISVLLLPVVWLVLITGLPGALLAPFIGGYAQPLLVTAAFGARVMDWISSLLAHLSWMVFYLPPPGWGWVILCYLILAAIALRKRLRLNARRVLILGLIPALLYLGFVWRRPAPAHVRVSLLSMGNGNCVLVRFPDGKNLLFDAGSRRQRDPGARSIVPALWSLGVRRLDLVILSHDDSDHYNGFAESARRIRVGRLAVSQHFGRKAEALELLRASAARGMEIVDIGEGDWIAGFTGAEIEVLWPPRKLRLPKKLSSNELSVVLRIRTKDGQTVLLTGDFGRRAVPLLIGREPDLRADLLQVPHHGLADPAAPRLAAAIEPKVALIPGGRLAESPSPYAAHGARLLSTDSCGMITVELGGRQSRWIQTFLREKTRIHTDAHRRVNN